MDFILFPVMAPLAIMALGVWPLAICSILIFFAAFNINDYHSNSYNYDFLSTFFIICLFLFVASLAVSSTSTPATSFIDTILNMFKFILSGVSKYFLWGLIFLPFLWFMEARQFARRYDKAKLDFKEKTFSGGGLTRSGAMEKEQGWERSLSSHGLSSDQMHSAKSPKGIARIFSFVFLWPAHLLDTLFGSLMSEVPSLISKLFGGFLDKVSTVATGSRGGMPD